MPRHRKPTARKKLEGTYRADRDHGEPDLPLPSSLEPPDTLIGPRAEALWRQLVSILHPARVLSESDLPALAVLCNVHAGVIETWMNGAAPTAATLTQLRLFYSEFGLTPASRSKTSQVPDADDDPLDEFFDGPKLAVG